MRQKPTAANGRPQLQTLLQGLIVIALGAFGCSSTPIVQTNQDAGTPFADGGPRDAGAGEDAGPDAGPRDAGAGDAGSDAGILDAGTDAGTPDAGGTLDAGPVTCVDSAPLDAQLWAMDTTSVSLPEDEGRLLRCYHTASFSQLETQIVAAPYVLAGIVASTGFDEYVIQYVSQSPPGTLRHVTALVYLPNQGQTNVPLVAVQHATSGMGPLCGVTHVTTYADYMAIPLVAEGNAVVATDYPGMGVADGVSPYGIGWAEGTSVLDAVRAAAQIHAAPHFDETQLSGQVLLLGHSQGGQATLFAHQLYDSELGDAGFNFLGSVAFAPAFGDLRVLEPLLATPTTSVLQDQFFLLMSLYADTTYFGGPALTTYLTSSAQASVPGMLLNDCTTTAEPDVEQDWPTVSDLFTASFAADFNQCSWDGGPCTPLAPYGDDAYAAVPGNFASTAPVLILQGEADTQVYPETTACISARLDANGTPQQTCAYAGATHLTVVTDAMGDALKWVNGRISGTTPSVCSASLIETCAP